MNSWYWIYAVVVIVVTTVINLGPSGGSGSWGHGSPYGSSSSGGWSHK